MRAGDPGTWLDDDQPHDAERSEAQIRGLIARLGPRPRRVLDLGCGSGRVLVPLVASGHHVTGLDQRSEAIEQCRRALGEAVARTTLVQSDFHAPWPVAPGSCDAVLCLGNTFMLLADVDAAVALLRRGAEALAAGGAFILDDLPADLWPELTSGRWQTGVSGNGKAQILWADDDAVFTLRQDDAVDESCWALGPGDQRMRLWTAGAMRLAAACAGLSAPDPSGADGLLVLRRPGGVGAATIADST